jgi:hypothetical protein
MGSFVFIADSTVMEPIGKTHIICPLTILINKDPSFPTIFGYCPSTIKYVAFLTREICVG